MRLAFPGKIIERYILLGVLSVVQRPRLTLLIAGLLLAASIGAAMRWLSISSDQDRLFSRNVPFFRDYLEFDRKFPENDALYVVIEPKNPASPPAIGRWTAIADAIASDVRKMPRYVEAVDARVPLDQLGAQGLLFQDPAQLHDTFNDITRSGDLSRIWGEKNPAVLPGIPRGIPIGPLMGRTRSARFLTALTFDPDPEGVRLVRQVADGWIKTLADASAPIKIGDTVPDLATFGASDPSDLGYYYKPDETDPLKASQPDNARHVLLVTIYPRINYHSLSATAEPVEAIRKVVNEAAKPFAAEFTVGTTGRPALDADEMRQTDHDSNIAEIIAAIAVFIGLTVMLRSLWLALAAEIALGVGIGWTFGWATISVGELNLLSLVFLIALIGIGMDYLVQILTRYRTEARRHGRAKAIWTRVFGHVSAPINTACLGAAGAFLVSKLTNFRGAADLGVIAGGGLLLCLLSGYTVLPALLTLFPADLEVDISRRPTGRPPRAMGAKRLIVPALWLVLLCVIAPFGRKAHFNPNLLDLQAPNLESTKLIRKLQSWSAVALSKDPAMLRQVRAAVEGSPVVAGTESILTAEDNLRWLQEHQKDLPKIAWSDPQPVLTADLETLAAKARALAGRLDASKPDLAAKAVADRKDAAASLRAFADKLGEVNPQQAASRLSAWELAFVAELKGVLGQFTPAPLDLAKVPPELRSHLVADDGTYALYINPKTDLWDRHEMKRFVTDVNKRVAAVPGNPGITGLAPNVYYTTDEVRGSFYHATLYALILIVILVLIDLKNIRQTFLAISVLGLGLPMLIGLMGLLGVSWNFANFFGLPILIGAGHEYGVFMIHRYREALHDPRRVWRFWDVSDRALLLCAYVTSVSFGFFWAISEHRGLKSLGLVMALGTGCIYLATVMVVRPLLLWRLEKRYAAGDQAQEKRLPFPIGSATADA
ncbi:MAG: transporter [Phycisphaerales bacterium]|nr:transporter [Phycisphaerales bacterium]